MNGNIVQSCLLLICCLTYRPPSHWMFKPSPGEGPDVFPVPIPIDQSFQDHVVAGGQGPNSDGGQSLLQPVRDAIKSLCTSSHPFLVTSCGGVIHDSANDTNGSTKGDCNFYEGYFDWP